MSTDRKQKKIYGKGVEVWFRKKSTPGWKMGVIQNVPAPTKDGMDYVYTVASMVGGELSHQLGKNMKPAYVRKYRQK